MIINWKKNQVKFDNFDTIFLNKLLAYLSIINSLNYKWYKSSKRRFLLPNFYFTRLFYSFYTSYFFKNIFRKKLQHTHNNGIFNFNFIFEKKMFLKNNFLLDFVKSSNIYNLYLYKHNVKTLFKDRFFFKNQNNFNNHGLVLLNSSFNENDLFKLGVLKKNDKHTYDVSFDFFLFFNIYNNCLVEFYKINILLFQIHILNNF